MAYNTRRGGGLGNVGQRRNPPMSNNFIPGGQLLPQNRPQMQQQGPQQGFQNGNFRPPQQQNQRMQTPNEIKPLMQKPAEVAKPPFQTPPPALLPPELRPPIEKLSEVKPILPAPPSLVTEPSTEMNVVEPLAEVDIKVEGNKKKPSWMKPGFAGKISRKERQRRRNIRLIRMLQPKSAVMILNELVKSAAYTVSEIPQPSQHQYLASVLVEEVSHVGYGHNKLEAKTNAAEAALKFIVKHRKLTSLESKEEDGVERMELGEEQNPPLPWQHVASFALYKLLNSWGEDPFQTRGQTGTLTQETSAPLPQNKPAKKMPENAAHMNPLMLLNQMLPQAQFQELGRTGEPLNFTFTFKCVIEGQTFTGTGPNKKAAKKLAAFAVCNKILGIQYPPEVYTPVA